MIQSILSVPEIEPVPEGVHRPLWSVMIPTYNCARYLHKTLESVLRQDPGSDLMQIMVIDNCSMQDDPEAVVKELGQGRVEFYRQPENIGSTRNFQTSLELSRGRLIHLLHGDDYVLEGFYEKLQAIFKAHPEIGAAFCRSIVVDEREKVLHLYDLELPENGVLPDIWLERIATVCCLPAPAMVVRREVYEHLGGFDLRLPGADDWEMWVRIANKYPIGYEATCLAAYREHSQSLSESILNNGFVLVLQEIYKAIQVMQSYLPPQKKHRLFRQAMQGKALYGLSLTQSLINRGKWQQAIALVQFALWMSPSYPVIRWAGRIILVDIFYSFLQSSFNKFQKKLKIRSI